MKRLCAALSAIALLTAAFGVQAQERAVDQLVSEIMTEEPFSTGLLGIKAVKLSGEVVADYNSSIRMLPASNVKIFSTGLAMSHLGEDYRFETSLLHSGEVRNGVLEGDLYIYGSGDPTLGMGQRATGELFARWKRIITSCGISSINGRVVADNRYMGVFPVNPSWLLEDITCGDGLEGRSLNFQKNVTEVAKLFTWKYEPTTSSVDTCAAAFCTYLAEEGIHVAGGAADDSSIDAVPVDQLNLLGSSRSEPLALIARFTNYESDNFYAEALMRRTLRGRTLPQAMASLGLDMDGRCSLDDGSGLSRKNYVNADFFCDFLSAMSREPCFRSYLASLPQPGRGTLINRLPTASPSSKNRVFMKSGSMTGVLCYSGYILPSGDDRSETIVFSILTNNMPGKGKAINSGLDRIIAMLLTQN